MTPTLTFTPSPTVTPSPTLTSTPTATPTLTATPATAAQIPLIEYHDPEFKMNDQVQMTTSWFEEQMRWLANQGYHTLSGEQLTAFLDGKAVFPQKSVVLTFDVGTARRRIYTESVIPILKKYGFQAIFFILANSSVVVDTCEQANLFCWDNFKQWANEGVVTIASHGLYHPDFSTLTTAEIRYEVETPRKLLLEKTGYLPIGFAYPFDISTATAATLVKAAGYQFAVAGNTRKDLAAAPNDPDRFKLPRVYPYSNTRIYPNLTGFNRPFTDVIAELTRPGKPVALAASPTPMGGSSTAEKVTKFCRGLSSDPAIRLYSLLQESFETDLSAAASSKLPGLTMSLSCNIFQNNRPEAIVLHYSVGDLVSSLSAFRQANGTSAHYIIDRDGKVVQMVPEALGAMHVSCTNNRSTCLASCPICDDSSGNLTEPYLRSIGIELINKGRVPAGTTAPNGIYEDYLRSFAYPYWEEYSDAQIRSLKILVYDIAQRWNIPVDDQHVIGHYRINEKVDPGPALNLFWTRSGNPPRLPIFGSPTPIP